MTELHTLASLANVQTIVLSQHILEHDMHPRAGDDIMLISDIKQIEQTVKQMQDELEKKRKHETN